MALSVSTVHSQGWLHFPSVLRDLHLGTQSRPFPSAQRSHRTLKAQPWTWLGKTLFFFWEFFSACSPLTEASVNLISITLESKENQSLDFDLRQQLQKHYSLCTQHEGSLLEERQKGPSTDKFKRTAPDYFLDQIKQVSVLMDHSFYRGTSTRLRMSSRGSIGWGGQLLASQHVLSLHSITINSRSCRKPWFQ